MCASLYNTYVHVESHISDLSLNLALSLLICILDYLVKHVFEFKTGKAFF